MYLYYEFNDSMAALCGILKCIDGANSVLYFGAVPCVCAFTMAGTWINCDNSQFKDPYQQTQHIKIYIIHAIIMLKSEMC